MKHAVKEWIIATRPWSFPASAMPVMVTMAWLWSQGLMDHWWLGALALLNIVLVHAAGNVWSDYFDFKQGVDAKDTYGVRTLVDGQFTPRELMRLSIALQILAVALGLTMVWLTGLTLLWIGLIGIALSLLYPPIKYMALGDLLIMACYSVLPMLGVTFICHEVLVPEVLWLAVPVGSITVSILHGNNTRDIETDGRAKIHTFAMLTGRRFAIGMYVFELVLPYLWLALTTALGYVTPWTLTACITIPVAVKNIRQALSYDKEGVAALANLDEASAKLQLMFSLTLIIGLVCATLL